MKWKNQFLKGMTAFKEMLVPQRAGVPLTQEIATRQSSIDHVISGFYLPNPDPILKAMGRDIDAYTDLASDGFLSGCIKSRKAATQKKMWGLDKGKARSRQAKAIEDALKRLDMNRIIGQMLDGSSFGYAPMEVLWEVRDNLWLPRDIVLKPQRWFVYSAENELLLRTKEHWNGELLPEYRFLVPRQDPTYANPYGAADLGRCFWPVAFKRNGFAFFATFVEKYGMPYFVGKLPRGTDPKEYDQLANILEDMVRDAIAAIPSDASVEILATGANAKSDTTYTSLINTCKEEISVVMLGHEGVAKSTPGKLGNENMALKVMDNIVDMDTQMVIAQMNVLVGWIYEINFGQGERPTFDMWRPQDVLKEVADRDKVHFEMGVRQKKEYFVDTFGFDEAQFDLVEVKPQASTPDPPPEPKDPNAFASLLKSIKFRAVGASDETLVDEALQSLTPEQLQGFANGLLKPVWALIESGSTPEQLASRLAEVYPKMDDAAFEDALTRALFVTELFARVRAEGE